MKGFGQDEHVLLCIVENINLKDNKAFLFKHSPTSKTEISLFYYQWHIKECDEQKLHITLRGDHELGRLPNINLTSTTSVDTPLHVNLCSSGWQQQTTRPQTPNPKGKKRDFAVCSEDIDQPLKEHDWSNLVNNLPAVAMKEVLAGF